MEITFEEKQTVAVLHVVPDRIDASVAIQFKDSFRDLIRDWSGPVVLDLQNVVFLDSSGLGAVVAARKLLGAERPLILSGLSPAVDKVMRLTRMNAVFPIHANVDDALATHGNASAA
ncbi:STAS domain-containing protein [Nioella nitratireducens]|uniref:STAS domain-containing protein n=1 Tax=Nioella nitratireducens TaxID=1287720 RepID=UPI0008FD645A|nr:STAS domain-containing protein [Nioella nitratireducens]